jgi:hypothetical protein
MAKIPRPKTTVGVAVALALEALRHPAVQSALRQAPGVVSNWRRSAAGEGRSAGSAVKRKVTGRLGVARLERRSRDLRALVAEPEMAARLGPDAVAATTTALDSIDLELRIARHQDLRDRLRMERRLGRALGDLVDALSGSDTRT